MNFIRRLYLKKQFYQGYNKGLTAWADDEEESAYEAGFEAGEMGVTYDEAWDAFLEQNAAVRELRQEYADNMLDGDDDDSDEDDGEEDLQNEEGDPDDDAPDDDEDADDDADFDESDEDGNIDYGDDDE